MEIIGLGAAVGLAIAAACMAFYRKGVKDGIASLGGGNSASACRRPYSLRQGGFLADGDEDAAAMMKRYETILSYDPYNSSQKEPLYGSGSQGERA